MLIKSATIVSAIVLSFLLGQDACAEGSGFIDGAAIADLSLKVLQSVRPDERRGGRSLVAGQVTLLPQDQAVRAATLLMTRFRTDDVKAKIDIASILGALKTPWATQNTLADASVLYGVYSDAEDETLKNSLDGAVANAQGLYRDGIADYNSSQPARFDRAPDKLKTMVEKFIKSRYSENASFYLGQFYIKAFFLEDARGKATIADSNKAFETYIARAEKGDFQKTDFLAAGYYFRALNGWVSGDLNDARNWLNKGLQKFNDDDRIYLYQLFYSTDPGTVIDKYLPAKTALTRTLAFLNRNPPLPQVAKPSDLINTLRQ